MKTTIAVVVLMLSSGCAHFTASRGMAIGDECRQGDMLVQLEAGLKGWTCAQALETIQAYRDTYEARFGRQDLSGIVVRVRATNDLRSTGVDEPFQVGGYTYADAIDLTADLAAMAHELNHVRTGSGHAGWCVDYAPWSKAVLGQDQDDYLGCH